MLNSYSASLPFLAALGATAFPRLRSVSVDTCCRCGNWALNPGNLIPCVTSECQLPYLISESWAYPGRGPYPSIQLLSLYGVLLI